MIGLIAGGLSAQPSIAAAAVPGSRLGFASRGCLGKGGKKEEKTSKFGGEMVALLHLHLHAFVEGFGELLVGAPRGEPGTAAVPRSAQGDAG